jgi:homeobox-leucine zipper protein
LDYIHTFQVTWIVHAEYDETTMPTTFRPLFLNGQAMGARRWLASLQMQREYAAALYSSLHPGNNNAGKLNSNLCHSEQLSYHLHFINRFFVFTVIL